MPKAPKKTAAVATTVPEPASDAAAASEPTQTAPTLKQRIADLERRVHGRDLYPEAKSAE
jgi:hypothetical protein